VTDTYEYDAFGVTLSHTGTMPNNYMYRGEQYDPDLGLYYRARYYNSLTGRFLSRDPEAGKPADPKTLHKYLYAGGDPVNGRDPSGRDEIDYIELVHWGLVVPAQIVCGEVAFVEFIVEVSSNQKGFPNSVLLPCKGVGAGTAAAGVWNLLAAALVAAL